MTPVGGDEQRRARGRAAGAGRIAFVEGVRAGAALGVCVVALAILGLSPSFAWMPEVPLLGAAVLIPLAAFGLTGHRAAKRSRRPLAGALAGAIAGVISGGVGGVSYMAFGKPALNVGVGMVLGAVGGGIIGAVAALLSRRAPAS